MTISNPGLKVIAAQVDTNHRPFVTISDMIHKMKKNEITATVTLGQVLDTLSDADNPTVAEIRSMEIGKVFTLGEARQAVEQSSLYAKLRQEHVLEDTTVGDVFKYFREDEELQTLRDARIPEINVRVGEILNLINDVEELQPLMDQKLTQVTTVGQLLDAINLSGALEKFKDLELGGVTTVGEAVDWLTSIDEVQAKRDTSFTLSTTVGKILDVVGEDKVKTFLEEKAASASYVADYDYTRDNVIKYWMHLGGFILLFALLSTITLEFIDKDKR